MAVCDDGNGGKTRLEIERRDLLKVGGFVLLLLTVVCGAALFVFQTRAQAIGEHAVIEQAAALHAQEVQLRREYEERGVEDTKKILRTLDMNQRRLMQGRVPARDIAPLPAGVSFEDLSLDDSVESHE